MGVGSWEPRGGGREAGVDNTAPQPDSPSTPSHRASVELWPRPDPSLPTPTVTAIVLARDEADSIERCLQALGWVDALIVLLDSATIDDTAERAARLGARVVQRPL